MPPKYTVSPHLNYFNVPLAQFHESRPEFESFAVGAYIFAEPQSINTATDTPNVVIPRTLLIQRSHSDTMGGCWEGPGGAVEPDIDETLLDGVAREVLEETGLNVSHFVDLIGVDSWQHVSRRSHRILRIAKYSFLVEVEEGGRPHEEIPVRLEPAEHQAFGWATEEEVREAMKSNTGRFRQPFSGGWGVGPNLLRAFTWFKAGNA